MSTQSPPPEKHLTLAEKLARRRERHLKRSKAYRVVFTIVAFVVVLGGLWVLMSLARDEVADLDQGAGALRRVAAVAGQPCARGHVAMFLPCQQDRMRVDRVLLLAAG